MLKALSVQLILLLLKNNNKINTSYLLHQIFTRLGVFVSIEETILEMEKNQLVKTDGYFEGSSRLIKNIKITKKGMDYISSLDKTQILANMELEFSNFDFAKKILS